MKCFIFAAGMGSRMGIVSKPLLDIGGETVIRRLLRQCCLYWTDDVVIGLGYKDQEVRAECDSFCSEIGVLPRYVCNPRYDTTGMLETLINAKGILENENVFYVLHGDSVMSNNIFYETARHLKGMTVIGKVPHFFNDTGIISFKGDQLDTMEMELKHKRPGMSDDTFAMLSVQYGWELHRFPVENASFFNINTWDAFEYVKNWRLKYAKCC